MNIGIFTYGTRGDVQPYIALSLGLMEKGHQVLLAAPENFKSLVESFGITFHPLHGDAEQGMNSAEGQKVVQIIEKRQLGVHLPAKKLSSGRLIAAIEAVQKDIIAQQVTKISRELQNENGVETAVSEIEKYFAAVG